MTLMVIDQRPSGIDDEVMSQIGTRITALLNDEKDIDAVFTGVRGGSQLKALLATLETSGLVETDDDEIVTRAGLLPARLDRLARDAGTAGLLEMTKELHASERQAYQEQRQTR